MRFAFGPPVEEASAMTEITDEMRAKVRSIRDQAQADPSFMERVKTDPAGVLRAEGIPDDAASQIVSRMAE